MAHQSRVKIDAIEVDKDLLLPHLSQFYSEVFAEDVFELYKNLPRYDLILMIDVIEHSDKEKAIAMLKYFLSKNSVMLIATPISFFNKNCIKANLNITFLIGRPKILRNWEIQIINIWMEELFIFCHKKKWK